MPKKKPLEPKLITPETVLMIGESGEIFLRPDLYDHCSVADILDTEKDRYRIRRFGITRKGTDGRQSEAITFPVAIWDRKS